MAPDARQNVEYSHHARHDGTKQRRVTDFSLEKVTNTVFSGFSCTSHQPPQKGIARRQKSSIDNR